MHKINHYISAEEKRKRRVRSKMFGTAERPRVSVSRSNKHFFLQAIDDVAQKTIASVHDKSVKTTKKSATKSEKAVLVASELAKLLKKKKITKVIFDRGAFRYHGRVKIAADALRDAGMEV